MKKKNALNNQFVKAVLSFAFLLGCSTLKSQEDVKYIFVNSAPGNHFKVGRPSTFTRKVFDDITTKIKAPDNKKLRLGVSVIFDFLSTNLDSVDASLDKLLALSKQTNVPVLIHLDGINWLNGRPDLWNWWDPQKPGYNPDNKKHVEWTGWDESTAIKISWRNWGAQFRVLPAPNLSSPAIIEAQVYALKRLLPRVVKWYTALPLGQKFLLGGVKLGHEASIGVNAYYYKDGNRYLEQMPNDTKLDPRESYNPEAGFSGGLTTIGYAAVKTAGIKSKGKLTPYEIEQVVFRFLDTLCRTANALGVPKALIYTHQGGTFLPWEKHLSFSAASNDHSLPGWSLYSTDPQTAGDLGHVLDRRNVSGWAATEWWWPGTNKLEWKYNLATTLSYKDCRFLAIFNWERGLEKYSDGIEAVREVIAEWK